MMNLNGLTPEQRPCVTRITGPLLINAGAGSGKTFTLTQRIAYALDPSSGPALKDIDEVCAITFTEKAAQEIKARVRRTLRSIGRQDQALKVDGAWISTIHGMCSRILHAHANELGLDPCFIVLDDLGASELRTLALEEVLKQDNEIVGTGQYQPLFDEYPAKGSSYAKGIAEMLEDLMDACDTLPGGPSALIICDSEVDCRHQLRRLIESYERLYAVSQACGPEAAVTACRESLGVLDDLLMRMEECASIDEQLKLFASRFEELSEPVKRGSADFKAAVEVHRLVRGEVAASIWTAMGQRRANLLFSLAQEVRERYRAQKFLLSALDQDDLLTLTLELLETQPDIAKQLAGRFKMLMVDEFQDTSKLQIALIRKITQPMDANLCTVGDAQQSIYRFRGADVEVYEEYKQDVDAMPQGRIEQLTRNFRSDDAILRFVAKVFSRNDAFGASFLDLSCAPDRKTRYKSADPRIRVIAIDHKSPAKKADYVALEAGEIAAQFKKLSEEGHRAGDMVILLGKMADAQVYAEAVRNVGLEAVITGGSLFGDAPEVKVMVCLAQCLVNPADTQALFGVLASEMFALGANELIEIASLRNEDGSFAHRRSLEKGLRDEGICANGFPLLDHARETLGVAQGNLAVKPLSAVMMQALVESGWLHRLEAEGAQGLAKAGNILKALRVVEEIESRGFGGCASVSREFAAYIDAGPKEAPGSVNAKGGNAVRIMTIHSSKGLEFPIVAVAAYDDDDNPPTGLLVETVGENVLVSLPPKYSVSDYAALTKASKDHYKARSDSYRDDEPSFGLEDILMAGNPVEQRARLSWRSHVQDKAELYRKLYVAFTRASECLIVALRRGMLSSGQLKGEVLATSLFEALFGGIEAAPLPQLVNYGGEDAALVVSHLIDKPFRFSVFEDNDPIERAYELPLFAPAATPPRASFQQPEAFGYTAISSATHGNAMAFEDVDSEAIEDLPEDAGLGAASYCVIPRESAQDGERATSLGDAFHRAAQYAAETGKLPMRATVDAICASLEVGDAQRVRLDAALESWFSSELFGRAMACPYHYAEAPFYVPIAGEYLEGPIDLLCLDEPIGRGKRAVVFDYKTGGFDEETPRQLYGKHLLQAQCYAYALLSRGYEDVELHFVRVERCLRGSHAKGTLETVDYRFLPEDLGMIMGSILKARSETRGQLP